MLRMYKKKKNYDARVAFPDFNSASTPRVPETLDEIFTLRPQRKNVRIKIN